MAKNKLTDRQYKANLIKAREFFNFGFDARNKMTPGRKSAITRAINTIDYANKNNLEFVKATGTKKRQLVKNVPQQYKTGKGVFVHKLKNADSVQFKDNAIITKIGVWMFEFYPLAPGDVPAFLDNPDKYVKTIPGWEKADAIRINVGEFNYTGTQAYQPSLFFAYVRNDLIDNEESDPALYVSGFTLCFLDRGTQNGPKK